jgi:fatty-acid peroxygenase
MTDIPRLDHLDSTWAFYRHPYTFISDHTSKTDMVETRLLLQPAILMVGQDSARIFYNSDLFMRSGAMPGRIVHTLMGQGGVQGLDDEAHIHRKQMFMSLMTEDNVAQLVKIVMETLSLYARTWQTLDQITFYDEMREVLCIAVCSWAGIPLHNDDVVFRTNELTALYDYAGNVGPKHWWARVARVLADRWAADHIERIRAAPQSVAPTSPGYVIAMHRDLNGDLLPIKTAAVELLNVLRPTVAVAVYLAFVVHALYEHPEARDRIAAEDDGYVGRFVQEVRRVYPLFPAVAARVRQDFVHEGCSFHQGTRVMLDLYGTNHDPRLWNAPDTFEPDRFLNRDKFLFDFIPQGGGDPSLTHRCPGERIAVEVMQAVTRFLVHDMQYTLPPQDMRIDASRLPALPQSRIIMTNIQHE